MLEGTTKSEGKLKTMLMSYIWQDLHHTLYLMELRGDISISDTVKQGQSQDNTEQKYWIDYLNLLKLKLLGKDFVATKPSISQFWIC